MSTDSKSDTKDLGADGSFERDQNYLTTRITADGRDGFPAAAGRYRLVVACACPWAIRAIIVRRLLGLEPVLSMGICGPTHDERSWTLDLDPRRPRPGARHRAAAGGLFRPCPRLPGGRGRRGSRRTRSVSNRI